MRSGINLKKRNGETILYIKSLLFRFMNSKNLKWDKRLIKEQLIFQSHRNHIINQQEDYNREDESFDQTKTYNEENAYMTKELLGLSTREDWKFYNETVITRENSDKQIQRFSSPILFKPIKGNKGSYTIYFTYKRIHDDMFNATFNISSNKLDDPIQLVTPGKEVFSMSKYFDFLFDYDSPLVIEDMTESNHFWANILKQKFQEVRDNLEANA